MGNNTSVLDIYGDYRDLDLNYEMTSQDYFVHMLRFTQVIDLVHGKNIFDIESMDRFLKFYSFLFQSVLYFLVW